MKDKFTGVQWFISIVTIITIILWCVTHQLEGIFGDMGVVAIIPIVLFFGTGILTKEDFNNFLWTIIILAAGGLALGKAVSSSGLLHTIAGHITQWVEGMSLYRVLVVFAALILVIATFISHTVAALIILPLVHQVGVGMKEPHPNLLVMASAFMCSAAMGLPTSGFPNMSMFFFPSPPLFPTSLSLSLSSPDMITMANLAFGLNTRSGYHARRPSNGPSISPRPAFPLKGDSG